jgi:hypothetical protein
MSKILSFDVESYGLYGAPFAVGAVLYEDAREVDSFFLRITVPSLKGVSPNDEYWLERHVFSHLPKGPSVDTQEELIESFSSYWEGLGYPRILCDCPFPVETNFFHLMREQEEDRFHQPYPLLDLASMLQVCGMDPLATYKREEGERPAHNPVHDARQAGRLYWSLFSRE